MGHYAALLALAADRGDALAKQYGEESTGVQTLWNTAGMSARELGRLELVMRPQLMLAAALLTAGRATEAQEILRPLCQDMASQLDADHPYRQWCDQMQRGLLPYPPQT